MPLRGIAGGRACHVADDDSKPVLARRVPGGNLRGKAVPSSGRPGLSEIVLRRVQAAVEAERERPSPPGSALPCPEPLRSEKSAGDPTQRRKQAGDRAVRSGRSPLGRCLGCPRPRDDEAVRSAFLLSNDLAVLLFRPHLSQVVGIDPLSRDGLVRWSAAVVDVYSRGVFAAGADEEGG